MARARNIKPGLFKNEILGVADPLFTLLFQGLWLLADRAGRLEDRPLRIKAEIFPYREGISVDDMLNWLQANGFIVRYQVKDLKAIQIINFEKHQNPHVREVPSEIPAEHSQGDDEAQPRQCSELDTAQPCAEPARLIPSSLIPDSLSSDSDAPAVASGAERAPTARGSRLPADWVIPDAWQAWAIAEFPHWSAGKVDAIACDFADYWHSKAGKDAVKTDWLATWRRWCRGDITQREHPPPSGPTETPYQRSARERVQQVAPSVAAKPPGLSIQPNPMEVLDGLTRLTG